MNWFRWAKPEARADNECRVFFGNEKVTGHVDVDSANTLVAAIVVDFPVRDDKNKVLRVFLTQGDGGGLQQGFYLKRTKDGDAFPKESDRAHRDLLESVEAVLIGATFDEIEVAGGGDKLPVQEVALTLLKKFIRTADQDEQLLSEILPPKTKKWVIDVGTRQAFALDISDTAKTAIVPEMPGFIREKPVGQRPNP